MKDLRLPVVLDLDSDVIFNLKTLAKKNDISFKELAEGILQLYAEKAEPEAQHKRTDRLPQPPKSRDLTPDSTPAAKKEASPSA